MAVNSSINYRPVFVRPLILDLRYE